MELQQYSFSNCCHCSANVTAGDGGATTFSFVGDIVVAVVKIIKE